MDENDPAVFLRALSCFIPQTAEWKSPSFRRPDHGCDFNKEAIPTQMTLEIGGSCLRFWEKPDPGPHTNQLSGEFEFGQCGFLDTGIAVIESMK